MICLLTTSLGVGGAETQVVNLAKELQIRGWQPFVVSMLPAQDRLAEELRDSNIEVKSLGMRRGVPDPRAILRLASILRRRNPVVLHSHTVNANFLARTTRVVCPVPVLVSTIHSINEGGWTRQIIYRITDHLADLTTAVSAAAAERFTRVRAVSACKMHTLPNGLDTGRFFRDAHKRKAMRRGMCLEGKFVWLAVGRFEWPKDYPTMLRAFAWMRNPSSVLLIAGTGPLMYEAQALVDELGLTGSVHLLGPRRDICELMNAADAYAMSSRWEGMPMALLEAAACELPIVATHVGGNPEVVQDGTAGFLVPPENAEALADAMRRMAGLSESDRRAFGQRGREHVAARYSLKTVVDRWEAVYRNLLLAKGCEFAAVEVPASFPEQPKSASVDLIASGN